MSDVLSQIPAEKQAIRGWQFTFGGKPIGWVDGFILANEPEVGTLEYGQTPAGYDGWCFHETGGGGSVIVPYFIQEGKHDRNMLRIGLVQQDRWTMGGKVWNLPRGFLNPEETHFQSAQREAGEELRFNLAERLTELPGEPANPNSAFFVTGPGEGVRFFGLKIKEDEVELGEVGNVYKLKSGIMMPVSKMGEAISQSTFVHYKDALRVSDMFTVAGVGRLLDKVML